MKPTPSIPVIGAMLVALAVIAFVAWIALKHIVHEQPATTDHSAKTKQTSMKIGSAFE